MVCCCCCAVVVVCLVAVVFLQGLPSRRQHLVRSARALRALADIRFKFFVGGRARKSVIGFRYFIIHSCVALRRTLSDACADDRVCWCACWTGCCCVSLFRLQHRHPRVVTKIIVALRVAGFLGIGNCIAHPPQRRQHQASRPPCTSRSSGRKSL